jgi:hypothetical protein
MPLIVCDVRAAGYRSLRAIRFPVGRLKLTGGFSGTQDEEDQEDAQ